MSSSTATYPSVNRVDFSLVRPPPLTPRRRFVPTPIKRIAVSEQSDVKTPTRSRGGRQADVPEVRVKVEQRAQEDLVMDLRAEADLVLDLNALTLEAPGLPQLKVEDISSDPQTTEVEILPKKAEEQDTLGDVRNDYEQIPPTTVEPSNESYTPCRTPSPVPLPKTGPEDSIDIVDESEDERTRRRPNTSTRRRRIIRDPDSESEAESSQSRAKVAELVDLSSDGDEEDEGEGKGPVHGYDIVKHYDESYGSLGDFIVDDHTSEEEDGSEEEEEDNHMLRYSPPPRPALRLPDFRSLSLDDSPSPALTPARSKNVVGSKMCRRQWEGERERIAQGIFAELNKKVFEGKLEGTKIEWSKRLLTTAGTATSSSITRPDGTRGEDGKITLSIKVLTEEDQILSTVAHEMCHLASWMISNERKNPHGKVFKTWGRKVMRARHDIEVTLSETLQMSALVSTDIAKLTAAAIDSEKQACGRCRSPLVPLFSAKTVTPFQIFLKNNMSNAKAALPGAAHGEIMRALSRRWKDAGPDADHKSFWREQRA